MRLPNGNRAIVDLRKLTQYCLSDTHDEGMHKARLFRELVGITAGNADLLVRALMDVALTGEARAGRADHYGQRYTIDFAFTGPAGQAHVRSAWIVLEGQGVPRLVTCYKL